jgi:hypothetical protein
LDLIDKFTAKWIRIVLLNDSEGSNAGFGLDLIDKVVPMGTGAEREEREEDF